MLVLVVTSSCPNQKPAVVFKHPNDLPNLRLARIDAPPFEVNPRQWRIKELFRPSKGPSGDGFDPSRVGKTICEAIGGRPAARRRRPPDRTGRRLWAAGRRAHGARPCASIGGPLNFNPSGFSSSRVLETCFARSAALLIDNYDRSDGPGLFLAFVGAPRRFMCYDGGVREEVRGACLTNTGQF
jgi:hypothetical protein